MFRRVCAYMRAVYTIFDIVGPCDAPLALIANIPDSQLSGSSFFDDNPQAAYHRSRLHTQRNDDGNDGRGAWRADENTVGEYIQADFVQLQQIQAIATQGRADTNYWVTSYKFAYSTDGVTYHYVENADGSDRVFVGNSDRNTVVENGLDVPIVARFVRLYPQTYPRWIALRWEVYGCSHHG